MIENFVIGFECTGQGLYSKHLLGMYPQKGFYINALPHAFLVYKSFREICAFVHPFSLKGNISVSFI